MSNSKLLTMARMAEAAERFSDMAKYMTKLAQQKNQFYVEERNMLSVAYKNLVGARRSSWRTCRGLGSAPGYYTGLNQECVSEMQKKIEREIEQLSNEVSTVAEQLLATNDGADNKVFYTKMIGDYSKYRAEILAPGTPARNKLASKATKFYEHALKASNALHAAHPTRLAVYLNYSTFLFDVANKSKEACDLAVKGFDAAIEQLDSMNQSYYKDSTLILGLIRDNLAIWRSRY